MNRTVVNALLALSGLITLVTGVLLFFRIKSWLIVHGHEWVGLFMGLICLVHLALNWKPFVRSLSRPLHAFARQSGKQPESALEQAPERVGL